jgi:hypothetical protein
VRTRSPTTVYQSPTISCHAPKPVETRETRAKIAFFSRLAYTFHVVPQASFNRGYHLHD